MSEIKVLSRTQKIIVDSKKSVSVVNAGPVGPRGFVVFTGDGDGVYMPILTYDPQGRQTDVFDASNLTGVYDAGTF